MADDEILDGEEQYEPKDAEPWLSALKHAEKQFDRWRHLADRIDKLYSSLERFNSLTAGTSESLVLDKEFDIFWASVEVIKPSIYSRAPVPVVTPRFKDRTPVKRVTAELLERSAMSAFEMTDIDQVMLGIRDDLVIVGRGQPWVTYEDGGDERVCVEHLDRLDFLHDPARKWTEVTWVARRAWLTRAEMRERFESRSGDLYLNADYSQRKDKDNTVYGADDHVEKAGVWEIWDKTRKKVAWVAPGCDKTLDEDEPHLKLKGFFPCPRPAYGTLQRRTLVPVPDLVRIQSQLESINLLTARVHDLVNMLVVKGIVAAGTDIGDAVEAAYRETNASSMLIPVPAMSLTGGASGLVEWLPIDQVAQTILAAVEARRELIGNVQELLGIADIQRGDSEAQETLGAQRIKVQFTSVRVRDRVTELVRVARDIVCIMAEIMAEEFSLDTLLKMAQMELPTEAMIKRQLREVEDKAKEQLDQLEEKAAEALGQMQEPDPQAMQTAQQQLQQAQKQILDQANEVIGKLSQSVTEEQVRKLLRETKTDPFMFDIETDSTVYPDEMAAKQSSAEMFTALGAMLPTIQAMVATGGAKAAGELMKDGLAPFRPGRSTVMALDEWIEGLESMPPQQNGAGEAEKALAESQMELAKAELMKAQAQGENYQAQAELKQQQLQLQGAEAAKKAEQAQQAFQLEIEKSRGTVEETAARIEKIYAEIQAMGAKASNDARTQEREDFKATTDVQFRADDQARAAENQAFDQARAVNDSQRADRGEDRADQQQRFSEQQGDRQQTLAEQTAMERGE